jgi:hypothetical protein
MLTNALVFDSARWREHMSSERLQHNRVRYAASPSALTDE